MNGRACELWCRKMLVTFKPRTRLISPLIVGSMASLDLKFRCFATL
jgi:hypothetical protein